MKKQFIHRSALLILSFLFMQVIAQGQISTGPFTFYSSNQGGVILGQAQINGSPALAGDIIAAFDEDDNCIGAQELIINGGLAYINLTIYGDDGSGNGITSGEDFFLKVYDAPTTDIINYGQAISGWSNTNFTPIPGLNNTNTIYNFMVVVATVPTVSTRPVVNLTQSSVVSGGNITSDGGASVSARGVCWNTAGSPDLSNAHSVDGVGSGIFSSTMSPLTESTTYFVMAYATNSEGTAYGDERTFTTPSSGEAHFETVWETPFQAMQIFASLATIDGGDMQAGDEIGIFDIDPDSGDEICVGIATLIEPLVGGAFIEIIASMDDGIGATNGFQSGNPLIFRLYTSATGEVDNVNVDFPFADYDESFAPLGTSIVELEGLTVITQTIAMVSGWNLVSFRTIPENLNMLNIFDPLLDSQELVKVLDQDGSSIQFLPIPPPNGQWSNSIGDLSVEQGYYVNVNANTSLTVVAPPVDLPMEIQLRSGWNMISMPCQTAQDAQQLLQGLISANTLVKVINSAGNAIVKIPIPPPNGQWVYGFTAFEPNQGYYVKVNQATSLTFDCSLPMESLLASTNQWGEFFQTAFENNPYMPMTIALELNEAFEPGDEIAVFDGEICVGSAKVVDDGLLMIPVGMDDPETEFMDGYQIGNEILIRVWRQNSGQYFSDVELNYMGGSASFAALETFTGSLSFVLTGSEDDLSMQIPGFDVYPNPFRNQAWITYFAPEDGQISIDVYDLRGQKQFSLNVTHTFAGEHKVELPRANLAKGTYVVHFSFMGNSPFTQMKKIVVN